MESNNVICGLFTREDVRIPLTGVEVRGDISGRSAKVKIRQHFTNTESKALEAIYKFPMPEGSSICGFKAVIGEKIIQGEVEERVKAFKIYDEALSRGDGAFLLDQERPNIFTLSLGNLNPGSTASIEVDYVVLLDTHDSEVRFFLPTTISPRYLPLDAKDVEGIPAHEMVNPPIALEVSYGLKIALEIQGKKHIQALESPSHTISTTFGDSSIKVELTSETTAMDRDFVLNIKYQDKFETRGYLCRKDDESFIQLDFSPKSPAESVTNNNTEQEVIFVLDCSGSMQGSSITEAKRALAILLKALEVGTRFNIYRFGSTFASLFESSLVYNSERLEIALKYLSGSNADLGGTEILAPLQAIQRKITAEKTASVVLLTDGEIGNEEQVIDLVRSQNGRLRMFPVGIGNGPNEYFIKQMARITGGAAELISPNERIEPKVLRLFTKVSSNSSIQDLKVDWGTKVLVSKIPSSAYFGETISIFARLDSAKTLPEKITVSGTINKLSRNWTADIINTENDDVPVSALWARTKIREFEEPAAVVPGSQQIQRKGEKAKQEIIALSKKYGIISSETSFVAVESRPGTEKTTGEVVLRKVPVMLTNGWGGMEEMEYKNMLFSAAKCFKSLKSEDDLSVPAFMRYRGQYLRRPVTRFNFQVGEIHQMPDTEKVSPDDANLLNILALQKAEGGFEIDSGFAPILKKPLSDLKATALKIQIRGRTDKFVLFSTAIVLKYLEYKYADRKVFWEGVVQKSRKWIEKQILISEPTYEGTKLMKWVDEFLSKQGIKTK
jgi:Ca-activated chloride channel homolog